MATTDAYDEMDRRNLALAARDAAAREAVAPPATEGRSFGFQSGASRPGGVADRNLAMAAMNGQSLGEPTSFNAGVGAPTPIGIIRGNRQTFATPTGGPQLQEFATPQQAGQAWNRAQAGREVGEANNLAAAGTISPQGRDMLTDAAKNKFGEFQPTGAAMEAVKGAENAKSPLFQAQAAELKRTTEAATAKTQSEAADKNVSDFDLTWKNQYASPTPKSGGIGYDYTMPKDPAMIQDKMAAQEIARTQGVAAGLQHYGESQQARQWLQTQPLPDSFDANAYLRAVGSNPAAWSELMQKAGTLTRKTTPTPHWYETPTAYVQ